MKKIASRICALAAVALCAGVLFCHTSCAPNGEDKKIAAERAAADSAGLPNYRYIDYDSVIAGYNLARDYQEQMLTMQSNFENTYKQKLNSLQSTGNSLQAEYEKLAAGSTPLEQQQFEQKMRNFQGAQSKAEQEMQNMQQEIYNTMQANAKEVQDSVESFLKSYNAQRGFDAIFYKQSAALIDPRLDITREVIEGLNKRYNKK